MLEVRNGSRARASLRVEGVQDKGGLEASDTAAVENVRGQERIKNQITGGLSARDDMAVMEEA